MTSVGQEDIGLFHLFAIAADLSDGKFQGIENDELYDEISKLTEGCDRMAVCRCRSYDHRQATNQTPE